MTVLKQYSNGFEYIEVCNSVASAKIALQGAHLFHYERHGEEAVLWVSATSVFKAGEAIRGGVPLCWPWFGMHLIDDSLPQHGFARTVLWEFVDAKEEDTDTELTFVLRSSEETLVWWPYRFELLYRIRVGSVLTLELTTRNDDERAFNISQALHTYFKVSHISNIHVKGLQKRPYWDALSKTMQMQEGDITVNEEIDRVYQEVKEPIVLKDKQRSITVINEGSDSVVIWNPWIEKCARMHAMEATSYQTMLCIESANALDDERTIEPHQRHTLRARIQLG